MIILRAHPIFALCGAACLVALTPEARRPPAELTALDRASGAPPPAPVLAAAPPNAIDGRAEQAPQWSLGPRLTYSEVHSAKANSSASDALEFIAPPPPEQPATEANLAAQFAYADIPETAPARGPAAIAPADSALPPPPLATAHGPPVSQPAVLYNKGAAAGLAALAQAAGDPAERLALQWASLRAEPHPSFAALAAFLEAHPAWPSRGWVRDREEVELALHPEAPGKVAAFFAQAPPQSSAGKIAAARAANASGRAEEGTRIIRALWRDGNFDALTESVIVRDFGSVLGRADHKYRADRLVYAGYGGAATRAAALGGSDVLALTAARIEGARAPLGATALNAVPQALRNDPGLMFSRVQYARRAGRLYEAAVLLSLAPRDRAALISPDRWWSERKMVARALLDLDEPRLAFEVCDMAPDSSEAQVDAAFHGGWIALRFLHDAPAAAERFARAAEAADTPLSMARAAYWQGRAAEAMGDSDGAKRFYERAASAPIAYYGQLAAQRLGLTRLALHAPKAAAEGDRRDEAVAAAEALYADGLDELATGLAFDAARQWRDETQLAAMADVVKRFGDAGTQVQFGKIAVMRGYPLDEMAFPATGIPAFVPLAHSADMPTVYAIARQESEFIWRSSSWAGAKGLMQMMPATAALTARRAGVEFDYARLIVDPAFNTQLGAVLLGELIDDEGGSRELAFAAYNAGPGRVTQWIAAHGDPRDGTVDLVDWIERIPFDETRDYVQRVSENLGVYRQRFADQPPARPPISARLARE